MKKFQLWRMLPGDEGRVHFWVNDCSQNTSTNVFQRNLMDFKKEYKLSKNDIINRVYNQAHANVWLACCKVLREHQKHGWVREVIREG